MLCCSVLNTQHRKIKDSFICYKRIDRIFLRNFAVASPCVAVANVTVFFEITENAGVHSVHFYCERNEQIVATGFLTLCATFANKNDRYD